MIMRYSNIEFIFYQNGFHCKDIIKITLKNLNTHHSCIINTFKINENVINTLFLQKNRFKIMTIRD